MTRQLDPKNQAIDFSYDSLGRVTDRYELSEVDNLASTSYTTENRETTVYRADTNSPGLGQVATVSYYTDTVAPCCTKKPSPMMILAEPQR